MHLQPVVSAGRVPQGTIETIRTGAKHVDRDNNDHADGDPSRGAYRAIPITDKNGGGTAV